jgi:predicted nucleic acid-binding protein
VLRAVVLSQGLREAFPALGGIGQDRLRCVLERATMRTVIEYGVEIDICDDPQNNKFLAGAIALDCEILVTQVPELLSLEGNVNWQSFRATNAIRCRIHDVAAFAAMY